MTDSFTVVQTWYEDNGTYEDQEPDRRRGEQVKAKDCDKLLSTTSRNIQPASQPVRQFVVWTIFIIVNMSTVHCPVSSLQQLYRLSYKTCMYYVVVYY